MNPYEKYQRQMVSTMTQGDMLLKLYDETLKQIEIAHYAIISGNTEDMQKAIDKATKIIRYLRSVLDFKYSVSTALSKLYNFFETQIVIAGVKRDTKNLDDVAPLIRELRNTYSQCTKMNRSSRTMLSMGGSV